MANSRPVPTDQQLEIMLGNLLRAGVILAGAIVLIGGVLYLARYGWQTPEYRVFRGEPSDLRHVPGVFKQVLSLSARGIIQLGFLLLIATPVARVAFSVYVFARQRDLKYVIVTLFVLGALIFSLAGGRL